MSVKEVQKILRRASDEYNEAINSGNQHEISAALTELLKAAELLENAIKEEKGDLSINQTPNKTR